MKMRVLAALGAVSLAAAAVAASAQPADRREDRWDRAEDRRDAREDVRDGRHHGGRADRVEDRWDRREDRHDAREDVRDAANPAWWRGRPEFRAYLGPRPGHYFAPGYGYYAAPVAVATRPWVRGAVVPVGLRRYRVVDVALYRLRPPPRGFVWIHLDNDAALISAATGVIMEIVLDVW